MTLPLLLNPFLRQYFYPPFPFLGISKIADPPPFKKGGVGGMEATMRGTNHSFLLWNPLLFDAIEFSIFSVWRGLWEGDPWERVQEKGSPQTGRFHPRILSPLFQNEHNRYSFNLCNIQCFRWSPASFRPMQISQIDNLGYFSFQK